MKRRSSTSNDRSLKAQVQNLHDVNKDLINSIYRIQADRDMWQKKAQERLDTQMLDARIKLASNLGQLVEAVSKAVTYVIGKEVL